MNKKPCSCHGKTEAELARPYAMFAFVVFVIVPLIALAWAVWG